MSVDMFERRFRQELDKLPPFVPNDLRDARVWAMDFPAWRALFTSMCLFGHSTGYRLPSYDQFFSYCRRAYAERHGNADRFRPFFQGDYLPGMEQRTRAWYESGMAETYLYVCLAEAIEDKLKEGLVLYDPRADWKLKADVVVIMHGKPIRINAFAGAAETRPGIESRRDGVERQRKRNTLESAHWGNKELERMPEVQVIRTESDFRPINGVRVFSLQAIDNALAAIYDIAAIEKRFFFQRSS